MMMVDCFDAMVLLVTRRSPFDNPACTGIYVDAFQVEDTQAGTRYKNKKGANFSEDGVPVRYVLTSSAPVLIPRLTNNDGKTTYTEEKGSSRRKRYRAKLHRTIDRSTWYNCCTADRSHFSVIHSSFDSNCSPWSTQNRWPLLPQAANQVRLNR